MSTQSLLCQNQTVSFADISTCDGIISQWDWNFGDGTPAESYTIFKPAVTHTFANPGPYTISLKVSTLVGTSVISDSTTMDIVVKPTPVAGFATEAVCLGVKTAFSDTTQTNGATMLYYRWEFGDEGFADTSNLKNPDYLYSGCRNLHTGTDCEKRVRMCRYRYFGPDSEWFAGCRLCQQPCLCRTENVFL
jgi:PKD repeat protein